MTSYFTSPSAPTLLPHFAIGLFVYTHGYLSTRFKKVSYKIDHNVDPRADLDKYGPAAVAKGKLTQAQLDELHRQEAAHQNAMVHYPVFLASAAFAQSAGLPNATINKICLAYALIRVAYGYSYIKITSHKASYIRSLLWWASNITCFVALWKAGKTFNKI